MKIPSLFKEYIWLIETIRKNGRITLGELNELWKQTEESGGEELSRTTFNRHRDAILDIFGVIIECDRKDGYRYYIENEEVLKEDCIQNWMFSTLSVGNMMDENVSVQNRILLESIPSGGEKLQTIINAMRDNRRMEIKYHRYASEGSSTFIVEPYCVKLFRRRWYVLVKINKASFNHDRNETSDSLYVFALDRIDEIKVLQTKFTLSKDFDAAAYFNDCFGIIVPGKKRPERIVIRAYGKEPYYLRDLPLHHTQKEINTTKDYTDFEMNLCATDDFIEQLMSISGWIKVLEPKWLASEIQDWLKTAQDRYKRKNE